MDKPAKLAGSTEHAKRVVTSWSATAIQRTSNGFRDLIT